MALSILKKPLRVFYQYDILRNELPSKALYSWSPSEIDRLSSQYGDRDWIRNVYFRFHPYAIAEMLVFIFALIALFLYR